MSDYVIAFAWGICLLISFAGWGTLINIVLFAKEKIDWGQKAAWGLALSVCVGGLLNLVGAISHPVVLIWVIAGTTIWLLALAFQRRMFRNGRFAEIVRFRKDRGLLLASILVCSLAILQYGGWVSTQIQSAESYFVFPGESSVPVFNVHDDFHAYFVFPNKMLATGSLGKEPFSERRLNSLGGQSFLHTLVLAVLPEENLHLLEPGVAILMVLGLLLGYFAERGTPTRNYIWVLLTFLLVPLPYMNISALVTGTVLFLSLFRTLASTRLDGSGALPRAVVVGLTAAAICALKSSLIPACISLLGLGCICVLFLSRLERRLILGAGLALILSGVFVLPWMIAMYDAFGTPLYPLLGGGTRVGGGSLTEVLFSDDRPPLLELLVPLGWELTSGFILPLVVFGVAVQRFQPPGSLHRNLLLAFLLSSLLGAWIVAFLLVASTYRFSYPFVSAAILMSMTDLLTVGAAPGQTPHTYTRQLIAATLGAGLLIGWSWDMGRFFYLGLPKTIRAGVLNPSVIPKEERARHRQMQASIPEGQTVLAMLEKPFLLDFKRNTIFIVDNPGNIPPSIPPFQASEDLASYLLARSVRYIAYSYRNEAGVPKNVFGDPDQDSWSYYKPFFDFHSLLEELGRTRRRIYDDGDIFVVDLLVAHRESQSGGLVQ
jgi:hypothetical protein